LIGYTCFDYFEVVGYVKENVCFTLVHCLGSILILKPLAILLTPFLCDNEVPVVNDLFKIFITDWIIISEVTLFVLTIVNLALFMFFHDLNYMVVY